jgi:hypothetical protein
MHHKAAMHGSDKAFRHRISLSVTAQDHVVALTVFIIATLEAVLPREREVEKQIVALNRIAVAEERTAAIPLRRSKRT